MTLWEALVCRVKKNAQDIQKLQDDLKHHLNSGSAATPPANWTDTFVDGGRFSESSLTLTRTDGKSVVIPHLFTGASPVVSGDSADVKTVVLNSLLPADIAADLLLENPKLGSQHSAAIQKAYDDLAPKNMVVRLFGNVKATKLRGYRPDLYGQDNQPVSGRPDLTRHGGQGTMLVHGENVTLDLTGCVYEVQDMFLDGIHLTQGNFIRNGTFRTKRIQEVDPNWEAAKQWRGGITGSKGKGNDWMPIMDADTGMSTKGTLTSGFNITIDSNGASGAPRHELAGYRSNTIDTSKLASGGYDGQFPQQDGSKAPTWGTWFGGWHGNTSAAIVIFTLPGTPKHLQENTQVGVYNCKIRGWGDSGITVGLRGDLKGTYMGNGDMTKIMPLVPYNVIIKDNVICDVYSSGIQKFRYVNMLEIGNQVYRSGHPDWSLDHKKRESKHIVSVDPGYGSSSGREIPQVNLYLSNFVAMDCARKGIDAHTGTDTVIENVRIKSGYYGISIAVEERFSDPREDSSAGHQISRYIVRNADIECSNYGMHVINGALSERNDGQPWDYRNVFLMDGLTIKAPRPYFNNYGRGGFTLSNTVLAFGAPYTLQTGVTRYEALYLGSENPAENNRGMPIDATLENIQIMNTSKGNFHTGLFILPMRKLHISNVTIHTQPYTINSNPRAAWAGEANMVSSGMETTALSVRTKPLVVSGGGVTAFDAAQQVHRVLDGELGIGSTTTNTQPAPNPGNNNPVNNTPTPSGAFATGVLKFNSGTASESGVTSNDNTAVIVADGNYPPTGYTLIGTDSGTGVNTQPSPAPSPSPAPNTQDTTAFSTGVLKFGTGAASESGVVSNDGKATIVSEGSNPPAGYTLLGTDSTSGNVSPAVPPTNTPAAPAGTFNTGVLKFNTGAVTADSVSSNDNTAIISAGGSYPPAGYTLTKDESL